MLYAVSFFAKSSCITIRNSRIQVHLCYQSKHWEIEQMYYDQVMNVLWMLYILVPISWYQTVIHHAIWARELHCSLFNSNCIQCASTYQNDKVIIWTMLLPLTARNLSLWWLPYFHEYNNRSTVVTTLTHLALMSCLHEMTFVTWITDADCPSRGNCINSLSQMMPNDDIDLGQQWLRL